MTLSASKQMAVVDQTETQDVYEINPTAKPSLNAPSQKAVLARGEQS